MKFEIETPPTPEAVKVSAAPGRPLPTVEFEPPAWGGWLLLRWLARLGCLAGLALFIAGTFYVERFDQALSIHPELLQEPQQELNRDSTFPFEYRGHRYEVEPVADYLISGLVVTHNDISSIADAYHTSDSVDFRDICLVWGTNLTSGAFRNVEYWSMPWSCHFKPKNRHAYAAFNQAELSNNHLLAADETVRSAIEKFQVGDQIQLRGKLINYWPQGQPETKRKTSLTRDDTGDGACEVLWVEAASILRPGSTGWHQVQSFGKLLLTGSLALMIILFFVTPLGSYRRFRW